MPDQVITSFGVLNYSGMLFNKGNTRTPFSTVIGGKRKVTNHVEFVTGQNIKPKEEINRIFRESIFNCS